MLAVVLAFIFGCSLSLRPVLKAGVALSTALGASARRRYVVDCDHGGGGQAVMAVIPGAMGAGLWMSMAVSLVAAFVAAFPANGFLLARGKGHALMHKYHESGEGHERHH